MKKQEMSYKITKTSRGYHLSGGLSSSYSPTGWANFEIDFKTKEELFEYILINTKKLVLNVDKSV